MFGYWQLGRLLDGLARGDAPAITGLPDTPFSLALHDEARKRYEESSLRLSPLGEALLRGEDDILRHRPPRFWWGGTLLTPERAWRWDASTGRLGVDALPGTGNAAAAGRRRSRLGGQGLSESPPTVA